MFKKALSVMIAGMVLTACTGDESVKVTSLQKKDKGLSCSEVMLEINEAEFYRKTAEKNKNPKIKSLLMPLGYISTYVDAEEAIDAADARVDYLNRIYEILKCEEADNRARIAGYPPHSDYNPAAAGVVNNARVMPVVPAPVQIMPQQQFYALPQPMSYTAPAAPQPLSYQDQWYW